MFMLKFSIIIIGLFVDNSFDIVFEIQMIFFFYICGGLSITIIYKASFMFLLKNVVINFVLEIVIKIVFDISIITP